MAAAREGPILAEMNDPSWILSECVGDSRLPFAAFIWADLCRRPGSNGLGPKGAGRFPCSF
jgi:hypothetical protein